MTGNPELYQSLVATTHLRRDPFENANIDIARWVRSDWCTRALDYGSCLWLETPRGTHRPRSENHHTARHDILLTEVAFGSFPDPGTFVEHWSSCDDVSYKDAMPGAVCLASCEYDLHILNVTAIGQDTDSRNRRQIQWRLEFPFSCLRSRVLIIQGHEYSKKKAEVFFFLKQQPKAFSASLTDEAARNIEKGIVKLLRPREEGELFDLLYRVDDMGSVDIPWVRDTTFYNCGQSCLGKMSAIHLSLPEADTRVMLGRLERAGFSLVYGSPQHTTTSKAKTRLKLPVFQTFDNTYALTCLLSLGFQVEDQLTERFTSLIDNSPLKETAVMGDILFRMANYITAGGMVKIEDYLAEALETAQDVCVGSHDGGVSEADLPPSYGLVRRLVITPTTSIFFQAEPELLCRVLRTFDTDRFIRVAVRDEDFQKFTPNIGPEAVEKPMERIRQILTDGVRIGDRHYKFVGASNSQLREHGLWLYAEEKGHNVDSIRQWIGDLRGERCVATYVSSLGQGFSSTKETINVPRNSVEVIDDIEVTRNGTQYCFTDGIGKISPDLANKVCETHFHKEITMHSKLPMFTI